MHIRAVLSHAASHPVDGALVFLDQEKAYDRVDQSYLQAVLARMGFSAQVISALTVTFTPTRAHILVNGHPLPAVHLGCGVRQGDPTAPLLFNLALEPFLIALRARLTGIQLPWGTFRTGAFADDLTVGLSPVNVNIFRSTLDQYQQVSNSHVNMDKSLVFLLSSLSSTSSFSPLGIPFHPSSQPIHVLGYDLELSPSGISSDWTALYTRIKKKAKELQSRNCSLFGRALLTNSLLFSKLWYRGQLSMPTHGFLSHFVRIGWDLVWGGHSALAPSRLVGRRSRSQGGLGFIDPQTQFYALQAQWIRRFLTSTRPPAWTAALAHALDQLPGGASNLASIMPLNSIRRLPECWWDFIKAWNQLQPSWSTDHADWHADAVLAFPLPDCESVRHPLGVPYGLTLNMSLHPPSAASSDIIRSRFRNSVRLLRSIHTFPASHPVLYQIFLSVLSCSSIPLSTDWEPFDALSRIQVATILVSDLTTAGARHFLDNKAGTPSALDWTHMPVNRYSRPPRDIWKRLHSPARLPLHRQQWYKLLTNALPIGERIFHIWPEQLLCYTCSHAPQTLRHFLHTCPLAQAVWQEFPRRLGVPGPITLRHALYSWSSSSTEVLGRAHAFRLQAGHAVALYVIWTAHTEALFRDKITTPAATKARFIALLARHFRTLKHSRYRQFFV
jgi:Reverse transcriptase (RNA-dependent DNA polymerase)